MVRDDFVATARVAASLLRDPAVEAGWESPSALPEFRVSGLAGHLAFQVLMIPKLLSAPVPGEETVSVLEHYRRVDWIGSPVDSDFNVGIRDGGEKLAVSGPLALAEQVDAALAAVDLSSVPNRAVRLALWGAWSLTLDDMLVTRMMELAVHVDDLACSVGVETPELPESAVQTVVDLLSRLAVRRHGAVPVLRALSRAERAPGSIAAI
ncbi:hypothetical protein FKR81_17630 [Lentzea tibetensis]|uniref:Mycothiol-dependent maleylpyruvate isomerase metal-binding domain-containing protein n=1 Tax=Lentzea tibetensis TaxID=2591470 RepID=A0A563ETC6_9PSEU|nr:maleylpyruvate isomerase N-terminal domain-containing protein [Lentzea tibetensis]TWP50903.1 hypothetical protein FKR81_17630 [Lentzea tibetensis]